jgi:hypothetical protein
MTIAQSFYTYLTANSAVAALVSDRIYPHVIPQHEGTRPCITFEMQGDDDILHLAGRSETRIAEIAVDCWAPRYLDARNLADTVRTELVGVRGAFGADTSESIRITSDYDGPFDDDENLYRVMMRFEIYHY